MTGAADRIIELYRRNAQAWVNLRGSKLIERTWLDKFLASLPEAPSILDLGCGSGEPIARYLIENGCDVTGVDASVELIDHAQERMPGANWIVADMRKIHLDRSFDGILAWNSTFHLTPDDQRAMFPVFRQHAARGAALMFTSGPASGETLGDFNGEALYHACLDAEEYRELLDSHGFNLVDHVVSDPECSNHTIWLARLRETR